MILAPYFCPAKLAFCKPIFSSLYKSLSAVIIKSLSANIDLRFSKSCREIYPQLVGKLEQLSFLSKNLQKLVVLTQANLNFVAPRQNIRNP